MLIIMLTVGIETGAWAFWYASLFSGFIVLLTAVVASITYLFELGNNGSFGSFVVEVLQTGRWSG